MKRQHNILPRHAQIHQLVSNACLRPIVLDPDFAVFNIQMQNTAKISASAAPVHIEQDRRQTVSSPLILATAVEHWLVRLAGSTTAPILLYSHFAIASLTFPDLKLTAEQIFQAGQPI